MKEYEEFMFKFKFATICFIFCMIGSFINLFCGNEPYELIFLVLGLSIFNFFMVTFFVELTLKYFRKEKEFKEMLEEIRNAKN